MTRNPNRRPTHPGKLLREVALPEAGITQAELARRMGVSRLTVSEIIHEKRSLPSPPRLEVPIMKLYFTFGKSGCKLCWHD